MQGHESVRVRLNAVLGPYGAWQFGCARDTPYYLPLGGERVDPGLFQDKDDFLGLVAVADSILHLRR
jgi:hypothetical protein